MKFYNREKELDLLKHIENKSSDVAQMSFVVGRRRVGKTSLLMKSAEEYLSLYFFVSKKNEALLCSEFIEEIKFKLKVEVYGEFTSFKDIFGYLMQLSKTTHFTLLIDEFQNFSWVNSSIFSDMQRIWDQNKAESKINLILCGSIYSMMSNIFENSKEPLFGRATNRIHVKEFDVAVLKHIINDNFQGYTNDDLLAFFMISGGIPKYVELLVDAGAYKLESILNEVFSENSLFIEEGKNVLIDEFGKDYGNYFSILSLIANSKTSRTEIESIMQMQTGGFIDRLEKDFEIIKKIKPIFSKPETRAVKYQIKDNFLNFWFRFIYKYRSAIEIGNLKYLKEIVERDYLMYSGKILEKYFINKLSMEANYSIIGNYWEKANMNEIDIIAVNELNKKILICDIKRSKEKINLTELEKKSAKIISGFAGYNIEYIGLSLDDM
ncbi:MAG: ATP-binding protein [Bacteroidales bacterium]|nr:ATP-binding protein [Bacteroidales bacterium]